MYITYFLMKSTGKIKINVGCLHYSWKAGLKQERVAGLQLPPAFTRLIMSRDLSHDQLLTQFLEERVTCLAVRSCNVIWITHAGIGLTVRMSRGDVITSPMACGDVFVLSPVTFSLCPIFPTSWYTRLNSYAMLVTSLVILHCTKLCYASPYPFYAPSPSVLCYGMPSCNRWLRDYFICISQKRKRTCFIYYMMIIFCPDRTNYDRHLELRY